MTFIPNYSIYKNVPSFCGNRDVVNISKVNSKLIDLRKNNFINGIYDRDIFQKSDNYDVEKLYMLRKSP